MSEPEKMDSFPQFTAQQQPQEAQEAQQPIQIAQSHPNPIQHLVLFCISSVFATLPSATLHCKAEKVPRIGRGGATFNLGSANFYIFFR